MKLFQICEITSSKRIYSDQYVKSGVPFYRGKEISQKSNNEKIDTELFITEEDYDLIEKKYGAPKENEILITAVGTIGNCYLIKKERFYFKDGNVIWIRNINESIVDPKYLYYYFITNETKNQMLSKAIGSTQKALTIETLKNFDINIPPLEKQKKIAKILSDIDKKTGINNKINENLRNLSQELYKRWFVDFDFPDENGKPYKSSGGKLVESELGMIPEDWKVGYISDGILTSIIKPGIILYDGEKKYVATADVVDVSIKNFQNISYANRPSRANMKPINNSVWFAKMQGSNKNILVDKNCKNIIDDYIFSTGFMGLECEKNSIYYIWNYINTDSFSILKDNMSTGTLMAGLSNSAMNNFKYIIPNQRLLDSFNEILSSFYSIIFNNINMNDNLENIKNILLPKLMNGEIDLDNIEI